MASGEFISILEENALKDLRTANTEITTLISNIGKAGTAMQSIKTPSGSDSAIKQLNAEYTKQQKVITDLQIKLERYAQAQNRTKISNNALEKSEISLATARTRSEKALDRENAKLEASQNVYNKVQAKLNALNNEYKGLATRRELGLKLTNQEEQTYNRLQGSIQKYDKVLKAVDATTGKYQRNVGNYAGSFNPLSNSINQLTREMPAFTYSVQTGFMALSNNIPIFTDAIGNAIKQNKELVAQGKPTTSVLSQLSGAFLSWQTLMGIGITLLTVYGKEIGNFISQAFKSTSAVDALKESQKQLNEASTTGAKNAVEETLKLKSLLAIAKDTALTYKERMIAVKELQDTYPAYFGNLKTEEILAGKTAIAERELTDAILSRAKANAAVSKITENQSKIIDLEIRKLEVLKEQAKYQAEVTRQQQVQSQVIGGGTVAGTYDLSTVAITKLAGATRELNSINTDLSNLNKINNTLTSFAIEKQKEAILLDYKEEKGVKSKTEAKKKEIETEAQVQTNSKIAFETNIAALEKQLAGIDRTSVAYDTINGLLQLQKEIYNQLFGSIKQVEEASQGIELSDEQVYADQVRWMKLNESAKEYIKTIQEDFVDGALKDMGFESLKMFTDFDAQGKSTFDKLIEGAKKGKEEFAIYFKSIGDVAQDTFNKIFEMSNANFENQLLNLTKERDVALLFAGESATAKEEIEKQYQEKQKAIKRKQFQAEKQQALFNIAIDGAQAIVATLASTPLPAGLPLVIATGAITAAQLAFTAAQKIPEFWTGTDNAPDGMALTQERGREIITDRFGKIKSLGSDSGAVLTNLNKGDKVFDANKTAMMFDVGLNSILASNGIDMNRNSSNVSQLNIMPIVDAINNKEELKQVFDSNGIRTYIKKGNTIKERTTFKGQSV